MKTCNAEGTAYGDCAGDVKPGVEDCTKPEDEDCSGFACSQPLWAKDFAGLDNQILVDAAVDGAGNVIAGGNLAGSADFGGKAPLISAGSTDLFVVKLASDGSHVWSKSFGDSAEQTMKALAVDAAGNVILTGQFRGTIPFIGPCGTLQSVGQNNLFGGDGFVIKLDGSGTCVWAKRFGGSSDSGADVAVDPTGDVIVVGDFNKPINFGGSTLTNLGVDIFVAKLAAADGSEIWSKRFGDASNQWATTVAADANGSVIFGGFLEGTVNFGSAPTVSGNGDLYVAKLDSSGGHSWSRTFGSKYPTVNLAVDISGSIVVTGAFTETLNFDDGSSATDLVSGANKTSLYLAKLSAAGTHVWSKNLGPSVSDSRVAVDKDNNVLLAAPFYGTIDFGGGPLTTVGKSVNIALAKYDASGKPTWSKRFGDGSLPSISNVAVAADPLFGSVILGGVNPGTMDFGTGLLTTGGDLDAVLAKFAP